MDTIAAIATPAGTGGIAVIRLSGADAFAIADKVWKGAKLSQAHSHSAHLGEILTADGETLDQAVATVFAAGRSFTGEPTVEFSIHGAAWLQREVLARLIEAGARMAGPGEFSQRAVMNGRMDLAQAEGVADLIAASSRAAHRLATRQMKGAFSRRLDDLRQQMIDLASLLELELDFSEEDVEFADRGRLLDLCTSAKAEIDSLAGSFRTGRALKEGVAVVIAGVPNAGKSTLLNRLLEDEKAIVSDIPGTTRDIIEDTAEIDGILYRFIDTAGLREATDEVERIGIDRAHARIRTADILLYLLPPAASAHPHSSYSPSQASLEAAPSASGASVGEHHPAPEVSEHIAELAHLCANLPSTTTVIPLFTKSDLTPAFAPAQPPSELQIAPALAISAKTGAGIPALKAALRAAATAGHDPAQELIVTNLRHYQALTAASEALGRTREALAAGLPGDLIAQDLREAIHHLSLITGAITTDTLLHTIFSRFCVGK